MVKGFDLFNGKVCKYKYSLYNSFMVIPCFAFAYFPFVWIKPFDWGRKFFKIFWLFGRLSRVVAIKFSSILSVLFSLDIIINAESYTCMYFSLELANLIMQILFFWCSSFELFNERFVDIWKLEGNVVDSAVLC